MVVERMKQCDDIVALAAELDIHRRLLYRWRSLAINIHGSASDGRVGWAKRIDSGGDLAWDDRDDFGLDGWAGTLEW